MRTRRAYSGPSQRLITQLTEPLEAIILEYVDAHGDELVQPFIQSHLQGRGTAISDAELERVRSEAERWLEGLPDAMLANLSLNRLGWEQFVTQKLNEGELELLAQRAMKGPATASSPGEFAVRLRQVATSIDSTQQPDIDKVRSDLEQLLVILES